MARAASNAMRMWLALVIVGCGERDPCSPSGLDLDPDLFTHDLFEAVVDAAEWSEHPTPRSKRRESYRAMCEPGPTPWAGQELAYLKGCGGPSLMSETAWFVQSRFDPPEVAARAQVELGEPEHWRLDPTAFVIFHGFEGEVPMVEEILRDSILDPNRFYRWLGTERRVSHAAVGGPGLVAVGESATLVRTSWPELVIMRTDGIITVDPPPGQSWGASRPAPGGFFARADDITGTSTRHTVSFDGELSEPVPATELYPIVTGDPFNEWRWRASSVTTAGVEELARRGRTISSRRLVDSTERLPPRDIMSVQDLSDSRIRVGDEFWANHERPDGRWETVIFDAAGVAHVVTEPCTLPGQLVLRQGEPWLVEQTEDRLTAWPLSWSPID